MRLVRLISTGCALSLLLACGERAAEGPRAARLFTTEPNPEHLCRDCAWRLTGAQPVNAPQTDRDEDETAAILAELGLDTERLEDGGVWAWAQVGDEGFVYRYASTFETTASLHEGRRDGYEHQAYERVLTDEEASNLMEGMYNAYGVEWGSPGPRGGSDFSIHAQRSSWGTTAR